ncbi:MAG: PPC domain-containing protein [Deltaproteobacteria bacterium]|nr:PPC domain-containing protein [Deltaproteobacteria bacterium]
MSTPRAGALLPLFFLVVAAGVARCGGDDPPPPCTRSEECPEGQQCSPDGSCVAGAECVSDAPCLAQDPRRVCNLMTFACEFRTGFGDECDASRPCAFGQFCSTLLGRCLDAGSARDCTRRGQCPAGQTCDLAANKCIPDLGCYGDRFCEEGEVCDLSAHTCRQLNIECARCTPENACATAGERCDLDRRECVKSGEDPACGIGEFCDLLSRCVQCTNSEQCGTGLYCNVALGRCDSNVQCADDPSECPTSTDVMCEICRAPQSCDPRTKRCRAPPTPCDDDTDCTAEERCDQDQDPPICVRRIPDCLNDLSEPNNSAIQAKRLEVGEGPSYDELKLCPGDADWYRIDVAAGTYLTVDARFRQRDGDIDVQLFLDDGQTLVDESRTLTDNERVELEVGTNLTLLVRAFLAVPSDDPVPYRLIVTRDPGAICPDDGHEPDDVIAQAKPIESDQPYEGRLCSADPDWFVISGVPAATRISARLDFTSSLGDLDLELYRAGSSAPLLRSAGVANGETLTYDASFAGDYYFRVLGKSADTNVYTVRVDLRDNPMAMCIDDQFEGNNGPADATLAPDMTTDVVNGLSVCSGDEDWYVMSLLPGEGISAEISFGASADLDLGVYGPGADPRASAPIRVADGTTPREHVTYRTFAGGEHYLRVHGINPTQISGYDLFINKLEAFPLCEPDEIDVLGRGASMADAFDLNFPPLRRDKLTFCLSDTDWFRVFLIGGFTNVIRLQYVQDDAVLNMALFDEAGNQLVATAGEGTDTKEVIANVPGAGVATALIQVTRMTGFETSYSLAVDLVPIYSCFGDRAEPNETLAQSSNVASSTISPIVLSGMSLCVTTPDPVTGAGDEDWYTLRPPVAGARIEARINHDRGDLFLELRSPGGVRRACVNFGDDRCYSDGFGLNEHVTFTATTTEPYYLRVGSIYSSPQLQIRPIGTDTPYRLRLDYTPP